MSVSPAHPWPPEEPNLYAKLARTTFLSLDHHKHEELRYFAGKLGPIAERLGGVGRQLDGRGYHHLARSILAMEFRLERLRRGSRMGGPKVDDRVIVRELGL